MSDYLNELMQCTSNIVGEDVVKESDISMHQGRPIYLDTSTGSVIRHEAVYIGEDWYLTGNYEYG